MMDVFLRYWQRLIGEQNKRKERGAFAQQWDSFGNQKNIYVYIQKISNYSLSAVDLSDRQP